MKGSTTEMKSKQSASKKTKGAGKRAFQIKQVV
jgi:hypothetical protein